MLDDRADGAETVRKSAREDVRESRQKLLLRSVGRTRSSPAYAHDFPLVLVCTFEQGQPLVPVRGRGLFLPVRFSSGFGAASFFFKLVQTPFRWTFYDLLAATLSGWGRRSCPLGVVSLSARPGHSVRGWALELKHIEMACQSARIGRSPVTTDQVLLLEFTGGAANAAFTESRKTGQPCLARPAGTLVVAVPRERDKHQLLC